jgi:hypothetical protein
VEDICARRAVDEFPVRVLKLGKATVEMSGAVQGPGMMR